jgi:hypothetical protein
VIGFIGVQPRRMRLDGQTIRAVCCSHLVVTPDARISGVAPRLVRRVLSGPQALTWSDTATDVVARMWKAFGGFVDPVRSLDWMLVLRGGGWLRRLAGEVLRGSRPGRDLVPVGGLPLHAAGTRLARRASAGTPAGTASAPAPEPLAETTEELDAIMRGIRLRPDYDAAHLHGLLALVGAAGGRLVPATVRSGGRAIGWYAYVLRRGIARVLSLACDPRQSDAVVAALAEDVRCNGGVAVTGRLEPQLADPLAARMAILGFARCPVVHVREPNARLALAEGSALLARLDGEWWVT